MSRAAQSKVKLLPRPRINHSRIEDYILITLYDRYATGVSTQCSKTELEKILKIPKTILQVCLDELEEDDLIEELTDTYEAPIGFDHTKTRIQRRQTGLYVLKKDGRTRVQSIDDATYDRHLLTLRSIGGQDAVTIGAAPAIKGLSDWEPLPIERSDPEVIKVQAELKSLISAVEGDNGYAAEQPDERAAVLAALSGLNRIVNDATVLSYTHFYAYIYVPLEKLTKRFSSETILGTASRLFWDAVKDWAKKKIGVTLDNVLGGS